MTLTQRLFTLLADGALHSGAELATAGGVSRSAVWKSIRALRDLGVPVESLERRGYRLATSFAPLDAPTVRAALPARLARQVRHGECVWSTGSTNADLLARAAPPPGRFDFLAAEYQSAGRGRRGRGWLAPPGGAVCLSLSWSYASLPANAGALSLAVGVCALRALRALAVEAVRLKWPNDLVLPGKVLRKLGGILVELRSEAAGPAHVVVGLGMNVHLGTHVAQAVARSGTQAASLADLGFASARRNALLAALIGSCADGLDEFARSGFDSFADEWQTADCLRGAPVAVLTGNAEERGIARGIDANGALLVEGGGTVRRYFSGDVSLRSAA